MQDTRLIPTYKWDIHEKYGYAVAMGSLIKIDFDYKVIDFVVELPKGDRFYNARCIEKNGYVYIFPYIGNDIYRVDLQDYAVSSLQLNEHDCNISFYDIFLINEYFYAVSIKRGAIYVFDCTRFEMIERVDLYEPNDNLILTQASVDNDVIYVTDGEDKIYAYNVSNSSVKKYSLSNIDEHISNVVSHKGNLYLAGTKIGYIYECQKKEEELEFKQVFKIYENTYKDEKYPLYHALLTVGNNIVAIPNYSDELTVIGCDDNSVRMVVPNQRIRSGREKSLISRRFNYLYMRNEHYIGLEDSKDINRVIELNMQTMEIHNLEFEFPIEVRKRIYSNLSTITESEFFALKDYI